MDQLSLRFITFTAWSVTLAALIFAVGLALDSSIPRAQVLLNFAVAPVGALALLLLRAQRPRAAAFLLVWLTLLLEIGISWRFGGLSGPNILSYPLFIVVSGWLLGTRSTVWMGGIISAVMVFFSFAAHWHWLPPKDTDNPIVHLFFVLFILFFTGLLTLLSRRSYLQRIQEVELATNELITKDTELQKLSRAVDQSPDSITITSLEPRIEYVNDAFLAHTGYSRDEVIGKNPRMLQSGKTPPSVFADMWATLTSGESWRGEFINRRKDGSEVVEFAIVAPIRQAGGNITHYVAIKQNVTEVKQAVDKIQYLTNYDPLTGLPNRTLLLDRLEQSLALANRQAVFGALIVLNIDRFKHLNDARGHALGDALLTAFAERLSQLIRDDDTIARLSADEFAILVHGLDANREAASHRAMILVSKIQDCLRNPFLIDGSNGVAITASLGVTLCPEGPSDTVEDIFRRADLALHRAKERGISQVAFFDSAMSASAEQRFRVERELRTAIVNSELRLFLQPQVNADGSRVGAEALVRWQHPERGLIPPAVFIPLAEESDLIIELDGWVMNESCRLIAQEEMTGMPLNLSVNISPRHFRQSTFVPWIKEVLAMTGADPTRLTLEVTEGLVIQDINDVVAKMTELTSLGIHFSIDDFGTGYSSLAYLKRLPIHELKIDKAFIQDAPTDSDDAALVETILSVAKHMRLKVVAEGVETKEQADFLNARGNVIHQGYLYGKPEAADSWIARWHQLV